MSNLELIGIWSADAMYSPGAASDEVFIFTKDGTGWIEFSNWRISHIETFEWSLSSDNKLTIKGIDKYCIYEPVTKSDLEIIDMPVSIVHKKAPSEEMLKIMQFEEPGVYDMRTFGLLESEVEDGLLAERIESFYAQEEGEPLEQEPDVSIVDMMQAYSKDAIEMASGLGFELDYSEASLTDLDAILELYHREIPKGWRRILRRGPTEEQITEMSAIWGGYLGEVIKRNIGGEWGLSEQFENAIALIIEDTEMFPSAKVYKRIKNGEEDHVAGFYKMIRVVRSELTV